MCITETKLLVGKELPPEVGIEGYDFKHCPTPTDKGGAGIFIADYIDFDLRSDLDLKLNGCEDIWVQLKSKKSASGETNCNNLVIGVIYRHPKSRLKEFENKLCDLIYKLK